MASSGIFFTQDFAALAVEKDRRLSFILKALEECSQTHNLAKEALIKLQANIDVRRAAATEGKAVETTLNSRADHHHDLAEMPSMGWVDGSMFDLGAFDLGAFGSLDPMAFRGIGADPSQWLAASTADFTADPALLQNWMPSEPLMEFPAETGLEYSPAMQGFSSHNFDNTKQ